MHPLILAVLNLVWSNVALTDGDSADPFLHDPERRAVLIQFFNDYDDADFELSDWVEQSAHQKKFNELVKRGFINVVNEARIVNGKTLFQTGYKPKSSIPPQIAIKNVWSRGLETPQRFLATNRTRERAGLHLVKFQSFVDDEGVIRCQGIWVKLGIPEKEVEE